VLQPISVKAKAETDQNSVRATTSTIGRGNQELRDIPQSVTVVTEKLMEDRRVDTVKEALHYTAGISFMALLMYRARQAQASMLGTHAVALLVALNLMHFWSLRPQLFSFLFFIVQVSVLDLAFRCWKSNPSEPPPLATYRPLLWVLPVLFGVWVNTHGGFVLGIAVLTAYLGLRSIEAFCRWGSRAWQTCVALSTTIILCVAASWVNPYGWHLHRWLFEDLRVPRPEIVEWRPPQLLDVLWWQWWLLVAVSVAAVIASKRRRDLVEIFILAIVLWQSLLHQRHIPFFAILCGIWLPHHISSFLARLKFGSDDKSLAADWTAWQKRSCAAVVVVVMLLVGMQIAEQARRIPVHRDSYPVSAFQFIADNDVSGRMVVRFKWSQYAIAAFGCTRPGVGIKVAFDGRFRTCYPQSISDMYFDFAVSGDSSDQRPRSPTSPPPDPKRILYYGKPELVLIDRSQQLPLKTMQDESRNWILLYQDEIAQLWGLREKYDEPSSPNYLAPDRRLISSAPQHGVVAWPALPQKKHTTFIKTQPREAF
jgi:hypothetical protein